MSKSFTTYVDFLYSVEIFYYVCRNPLLRMSKILTLSRFFTMSRILTLSKFFTTYVEIFYTSKIKIYYFTWSKFFSPELHLLEKIFSSFSATRKKADGLPNLIEKIFSSFSLDRKNFLQLFTWSKFFSPAFYLIEIFWKSRSTEKKKSKISLYWSIHY